MDQNYNADSIQVLKGLEAVKKRPGMYIGDVENGSGLHQMVYEVVDNAIDESFAGYCTEVSISLNEDGSCTVSDNGRGIPVDMHEEGMSAAEVIMTQLHSGGKFNQNTYKISGGLHGVGVSVVNALSEYLILNIKRDGYIHNLRFENGITVQAITKGERSSETGTEITFLPSKEIFSHIIEFDFEKLSSRFRELSYLNNIKITLQDKIHKRKEVFHSYGGIKEFIQELNANKEIIHESIINMKNEYAEIAMQWNKSSSEKILCFTNNIPQSEGGTHLAGLKSGLTRIFANTIKDKKMTSEDIREGLTCIISLKIPDPRFDSQTKNKLVSAHVKKLVESLLIENMSIWLEENQSEASAIIDRIKLSINAREAARRAREIARKTSELEISSLPGKLADCSNKNPQDRELFIVEGDSAGGSAKQARDRIFQAILPLRGKVLNVEKAKFAKVINSEQIGTLIKAIGTGIGKEFNIDNCRYHKIILMTDADIDGSHIRTLLLTFFFNYMPEVIKRGFLYIAQPPLYGIRQKKNMIYIKNDQELNKYIFKRGLDSIQYDGDIEDIDISYIPVQLHEVILSTISKYSLQEVRENPDHFFNIQNGKIIHEDIEIHEEILFNSSLDKINWDKYKNLILNNKEINLGTLISMANEAGRKDLYIQRFKGLGEMKPEELWNTTLDPNIRTLLKVNINDFNQSQCILNDLMGDLVEPRRRFIEDNALNVQNLDA